jgi:hypothetical protein
MGFVEREGFDERGVIAKNGMDLARDRAIDLKAWRHEDKCRATPHGGGGRHRRAHAEGTGLIAGCGHHAALGVVANSDRLPTKRRIVRCSTDA